MLDDQDQINTQPKTDDQTQTEESAIVEQTQDAPKIEPEKEIEAPEEKLELEAPVAQETPEEESQAETETEEEKKEVEKTEVEIEEAKDDKPEEETTPKDLGDSQKDVKGAHWYVVHTYSGHEAKVAATLKQRVESQKHQDKILDILVPKKKKIEIKEGKKSTIKEKIFPGYLLIRMVLDDNTWLAVRTTPGITSFVGNANKPTPLPEDEVASIRKFMAMEAPKFKTAFSMGEAVKITDGPFSEFLGSISEIDEEKGKLKVMVSIFGRETPVELDFLQVAKL